MEKEKPLPNRLREWRLERNLTQEELGAKLNLTKGQVSNLEKGIRRLTPDYQKEIAKILKIEPWELLLNEELPSRVIEIAKNPKLLEQFPVSIDSQAIVVDKNFTRGLQNPKLLALTMPDESMAPKIEKGSYLVVDMAQNALKKDLEGVYLFMLKDKFYVRTVEVSPFKETISLIASNPDFAKKEERIFRDLDILEISKVVLQGEKAAPIFALIGKVVTVITTL